MGTRAISNVLVPYLINECWAWSWSRFHGSQPAVDLVVYLTVSCHYFPPGPRLSSQLKSVSAPWPVPNYISWWQRHRGVCSLPKPTTRCPVTTWTTDLWIASPTLAYTGFPLFCSEKFPVLFQDFPVPQAHFPGLSHTPVTCTYRDKQKLLTTYVYIVW